LHVTEVLDARDDVTLALARLLFEEDFSLEFLTAELSMIVSH